MVILICWRILGEKYGFPDILNLKGMSKSPKIFLKTKNIIVGIYILVILLYYKITVYYRHRRLWFRNVSFNVLFYIMIAFLQWCDFALKRKEKLHCYITDCRRADVWKYYSAFRREWRFTWMHRESAIPH